MLLKEKVWDQDPLRPSCQYKGDLFATERQKAENKRQRPEIEDEGEEEGNKGKGVASGQLSWLWHQLLQGPISIHS